jgi:hypothetical protein
MSRLPVGISPADESSRFHRGLVKVNQMPATAFNRNTPPNGYIDLRSAIYFVRSRMFTAEIPVHLIEAAKANLAHAANLTPDNLPKLPQIASYPKPIKFIADALRSGGLILFIYAESRDNVVRLPAICTHEVLERAGFFHEGLHTRATLPTDRCHLNDAAVRINRDHRDGTINKLIGGVQAVAVWARDQGVIESASPRSRKFRRLPRLACPASMCDRPGAAHALVIQRSVDVVGHAALLLALQSPPMVARSVASVSI